jgi:hypothetical protein
MRLHFLTVNFTRKVDKLAISWAEKASIDVRLHRPTIIVEVPDLKDE